MSKYIISVEATADLPDNVLKKYELRKVDMNFSIDGKEYSSSSLDMTPNMFYEKMKSGSKTSTSQVNQYDGKKYFEELLKEGKDILHLSFSSALSGMYNSLKTVADELNATHKNKIIVVDSLCASAGQGYFAIMCAKKQNEYNTIEELGEYAESLKLHISHLFIVDSLKYLCRSGRVSKLTAAIGTVLQIKPVLHVDNKGFLTSIGKVISRKKSLNNIVERFKKMKTDDCDMVFICNANCKDDAEFVKAKIKEETNLEAEIFDLGCVIGSHSGPGTLAVYFTCNSRE